MTWRPFMSKTDGSHTRPLSVCHTGASRGLTNICPSWSSQKSYKLLCILIPLFQMNELKNHRINFPKVTALVGLKFRLLIASEFIGSSTMPCDRRWPKKFYKMDSSLPPLPLHHHHPYTYIAVLHKSLFQTEEEFKIYFTLQPRWVNMIIILSLQKKLRERLSA